VKDDDDSTVKFRPVEGAAVQEDWRRSEGFRLEADWIGERFGG
jgi:hypothetical protein